MQDVVFFEDGNFEDVLGEELNKNFSGNKVAVKLHMGEKGNTHYLKPDLVKKVVDVLKNLGLNPFLFDSPVMYPGGRNTVEKYYRTAREHGFSEETIGCPIVISNEFVIVKTEHLDAQVCKPLSDADNLLVLSHVKGHMCSGFGGAIKNLGMGGMTIKSKSDIHEGGSPVFAKECVGCGTCVKMCPVQTISLEEGKAVFDYSGCWGCGVCINACPYDVLKPKVASFDRLISEGAYAVLKGKKAYFVNVIKEITKLCDCASDSEIVLSDIGIIMGKDIVAVEKASVDMINKKAGKDLFKEIHNISPLGHIKEAADLGLGRMEYNLK
ncbi:MAG: DUF362 domain-containing protein [Nanoarchaeota archaeon]